MGLFRYIVEGFGWEIGRSAAREGIERVSDHLDEEEARQPTAKELALADKERAKQAAAAKKEREAAVARKAAEIEAQLAALKKKAK